MIAQVPLADIAQVVGIQGEGAALEVVLRDRWPGLRFAVCSDDDVPPRLAAAFAGDGFNLYFIGGGEHCLALTADAGAAIGVVVAWCLPDA